MELTTWNLPVLPLRGLTVFPHMSLTLDVERRISIAALERAMEEDQDIFLVTQREIGVNAPGEKDLYTIGNRLPYHPGAAAGSLCRPGDGGGPPAGPSAPPVADGALPPGPMWRLCRRSPPLKPCGRAPGRRPLLRQTYTLFGAVRPAGQRCAGRGGHRCYGQPGPPASWRTTSPRTSLCATRQTGDPGGVLSLLPGYGS